jgi:hypothetical protein
MAGLVTSHQLIYRPATVPNGHSLWREDAPGIPDQQAPARYRSMEWLFSTVMVRITRTWFRPPYHW